MDRRNLPSEELLEGRDVPPTHYIIKIESFSFISNTSIGKYSSDTFEAGDYKWILSIYPNGDGRRDGEDHISIYLALADTSSLPHGWEINVIFKFFVYDQIKDKYFSPQDGNVRRFRATKTEWGVEKFISHKAFSDPSNGYLIDDTCVFGAEVFVLKQPHKCESLSMINSITGDQAWQITCFSSLTEEYYESLPFVVGNYKWRILLHPHGVGSGTGNSVSVYLSLDDSTLPPDTILFVRYSLSTVNQINEEHLILEGVSQFSHLDTVWGFEKCISLAELNDSRKGFLWWATHASWKQTSLCLEQWAYYHKNWIFELNFRNVHEMHGFELNLRNVHEMHIPLCLVY